MKSGQLIDFPLFTSRQYFPDQILIYWPGFLVDRGITWAAAKWPSEQFPSPPFSRSPLVPHDMHVQLDHFPKEVGVKIQKSECYTHPVRESPQNLPYKVQETLHFRLPESFGEHIIFGPRPTPQRPNALGTRIAVPAPGSALEVGFWKLIFPRNLASMMTGWGGFFSTHLQNMRPSKWLKIFPQKVGVKMWKNVNESTTCQWHIRNTNWIQKPGYYQFTYKWSILFCY